MYENIVIESNTNVFDNMGVQGVCDGAAHQMRMIKRARSERRTLDLFMFLFLLWCGPHGLCAVVSSLCLPLCLFPSVFSLINPPRSVALVLLNHMYLLLPTVQP